MLKTICKHQLILTDDRYIFKKSIINKYLSYNYFNSLFLFDTTYNSLL